MNYFSVNNFDDLELVLKERNVDEKLSLAVEKCFLNFQIHSVEVKPHGLIFHFTQNNSYIFISNEKMKNLEEKTLNIFLNFSKFNKPKVYDSESLVALCQPFEKIGFEINDQIGYKFILKNDKYILEIDLEPSIKSGQHGRIMLYDRSGKYLKTLNNIYLKSILDVKNLIDESLKKYLSYVNFPKNENSSLKKMMDNYEAEELFNLDYKFIENKNTIEIFNNKVHYKISKFVQYPLEYLLISEQNDNVLLCKRLTNDKNDNKHVLKHIIDRHKLLSQKIFENASNVDLLKLKKEFIKKDYKNNNEKIDNISSVEKLYDYMNNHDMSISDTFFDYLKAATKQKKLVSIHFNKPYLMLEFDNGSLEVKMEAEFSHFVGNIPHFYWKPKKYMFTIENLRKLIPLNREKADIVEVKMLKNFKKLSLLGFKDISSREDDIKRSVILNKGIYTYKIHSNGSIFRACDKMKYSVLLEEGSYLYNIQEYEEALQLVLDNYKKYSKAYGFQIN